MASDSDLFTPATMISKYSGEGESLDLRAIAVLLIAHLDRLSEKYAPPTRSDLGVTNAGSAAAKSHVPLAVEIQLCTFAKICDLLQHAQKQLSVADTLTSLRGPFSTSSETRGSTIEIYVSRKQVA